LGVAFQVIDDALDYGRGDGNYGKNVGDDLAEGKATLPVIHALACLDADTAAPIRAAVRDGNLDAMDSIMKAIESTQAMEYTCRRAEEEAAKAIAALSAFEESEAKRGLVELAEFSAQRRH
jgi:octaprenyl-diphosphate synthase